ncbi:MAG TPA: hypothetical protein PL155_06385 [Candidatus Omnitrophota bacterium]|nr:hypothetical protein [Candidatus Omnitrophota bacterium]HPD83894.1 hypothetical protein [Candidatus Omnitrophota bacterium]HRZ02751.1 hypothetical protein [Candidatus Omnitrophota bacterium]
MVEQKSAPVAEPIKNCAGCNKPLKKAKRYYCNGKYYCNKRCYKKAGEAEAAPKKE